MIMDENDCICRNHVFREDVHLSGCPQHSMRKKTSMKKFICNTTIEIEAENEDDARIELIFKMDAHDICWEVEESDD